MSSIPSPASTYITAPEHPPWNADPANPHRIPLLIQLYINEKRQTNTRVAMFDGIGYACAKLDATDYRKVRSEIETIVKAHMLSYINTQAMKIKDVYRTVNECKIAEPCVVWKDIEKTALTTKDDLRTKNGFDFSYSSFQHTVLGIGNWEDVVEAIERRGLRDYLRVEIDVEER